MLWASDAHESGAGIHTVHVLAHILMTEVLQVGNGLCQPLEPLVGMSTEWPLPLPMHA